MKKVNPLTKKFIKERARIWIKELMDLAREAELKGEKDLEKEYIKLILEISKHYKVKIPDKRYICKNCYSILIPGLNSTIRIKRGRVIIKCLNCGNIKRYIIRKNRG